MVVTKLVFILGLSYTSLTLASETPPVKGGTDIGGGGNAWVCFDSTVGLGTVAGISKNEGVIPEKFVDNIISITPLEIHFADDADAFDASTMTYLPFKAGEKPLDFVQRMIKRFELSYPALYESLTNAMLALAKAEKGKADEGIYRIPDLFPNKEMPVVLDTDFCTWITVLTQRGNPKSQTTVLITDKRLFNHKVMTDYSRAVLMLHEAVLYVQRSYISKATSPIDEEQASTEPVRNLTLGMITNPREYQNIETLYLALFPAYQDKTKDKYRPSGSMQLLAPVANSFFDSRAWGEFVASVHGDKYVKMIDDAAAIIEKKITNYLAAKEKMSARIESLATNKKCKATEWQLSRMRSDIRYVTDNANRMKTQIFGGFEKMKSQLKSSMFFANETYKEVKSSFKDYEELRSTARDYEVESFKLSAGFRSAFGECMTTEDESMLASADWDVVNTVYAAIKAIGTQELYQSSVDLLDKWVKNRMEANKKHFNDVDLKDIEIKMSQIFSSHKIILDKYSLVQPGVHGYYYDGIFASSYTIGDVRAVLSRFNVRLN